MQLLKLDNGNFSLEFIPAEWPAVRARLEALGVGERQDRVDHAILRGAGTHFVLMQDWDEPCVIASDPTGNAILARLQRELEERPALSARM